MNNLQLAIEMELDGERYYREQAAKQQGNKLEQVFLMLAEDEVRHATVLQQRLGGAEAALGEQGTLASARNVFVDLPSYQPEHPAILSQLDVYRMALGMEKQSIQFYEQLMSAAPTEAERDFYAQLVAQEQDHYTLLEELVTHVGRPESWVESAEFGRRKPY